jgi:hypothetical protein
MMVQEVLLCVMTSRRRVLINVSEELFASFFRVQEERRMLLRNTNTRHDQNLSQDVWAENKAPSSLVGCERCQAVEDLGRYCN